MKIVDVQLDEHRRIIRIFRNFKSAVRHPLPVGHELSTAPKAEAVEAIRRQVFEKQNFCCRHCESPITWESGEMNEKHFKGKGGEVSVDNCEALCHGCHQGPSGVHGNRRPQWSRHA